MTTPDSTPLPDNYGSGKDWLVPIDGDGIFRKRAWSTAGHTKADPLDIPWMVQLDENPMRAACQTGSVSQPRTKTSRRVWLWKSS